jgi:hypothetical protein
MTRINPPDDDAPARPELDVLLHRSAPEPLVDTDFTTRVMRAVRVAARPVPAMPRAAASPAVTRAQALACEQHRHAAQARLWRWSLAGAAAGAAALALAMVGADTSPLEALVADPPLPLWGAALAGAAWLVLQALEAS